MPNEEAMQALAQMQRPPQGQVNTQSPVADSVHNLSVNNPGVPPWLATLMGMARTPFYDNPVPYLPPPVEGFPGTTGGQTADARAVAQEVGL